MVVGGVLLGGVVTNGLAAGWIVAQGEFQGCVSSLPDIERLLYDCDIMGTMNGSRTASALTGLGDEGIAPQVSFLGGSVLTRRVISPSCGTRRVSTASNWCRLLMAHA